MYYQTDNRKCGNVEIARCLAIEQLNLTKFQVTIIWLKTITGTNLLNYPLPLFLFTQDVYKQDLNRVY